MWGGHPADSEREGEGSHLLEEEQHEHLETERPLDLDAQSGGLGQSSEVQSSELIIALNSNSELWHGPE